MFTTQYLQTQICDEVGVCRTGAVVEGDYAANVFSVDCLPQTEMIIFLPPPKWQLEIIISAAFKMVDVCASTLQFSTIC